MWGKRTDKNNARKQRGDDEVRKTKQKQAKCDCVRSSDEDENDIHNCLERS